MGKKDNYITVNFTEKASKVISFIATPDEPLTMQNVTCGASVGFDKANIECNSPNVDYKVTSSSNIWFLGIFRK